MVAPTSLPPLPPHSQQFVDPSSGKINTYWYNWLKAFEQIFRNPETFPTYAPTDAAYLLFGANHAGLSADRKLVAGTGISLTDGGPNGDLTIANTVPPGGGTDLAGVLPATSGTTLTLTNIPACKALMCVIAGVSHNAAGATTRQLRLALSTNNGASFGTPNLVGPAVQASFALAGIVWVARLDAGGAFVVGEGTPGGTLNTIDTSVSGTVDAIQWSLTGDSFDGGAISVYTMR